jgi:hypothetical protein
VPVVTALTLAVGPAAGGSRVVVSGRGFNLTSSVTVGGTPAIAQVVSDHEIHLTTPAHAPGPAQVVVVVGTEHSPATEASVFTFIAAPVVQSVGSDDWRRSDAKVEIRGKNLGDTTAVTFNRRASVGLAVSEDGTEIRANRPPGPVGKTEIVITTPGGNSPAYEVWFLPDGTQRAIFITQLLYSGLLIGGLIAYVTWTHFRNYLPDPISIVPLGVPWSGALGAVTLSISGLVYHRTDWDRSYIYWHLSRPIIGAVMGGFAYLVVAAGVLASGGSPSSSSTGVVTATPSFHVTNLFYFVLAFLVGYREETFRDLLQKFADVLFGPGNAAAKVPANAAPATSQPGDRASAA